MPVWFWGKLFNMVGGLLSSTDLSVIEQAKIDCAEKLFNSISTANVKYHKVATYQDLIDGMNTIRIRTLP